MWIELSEDDVNKFANDTAYNGLYFRVIVSCKEALELKECGRMFFLQRRGEQ